MSLIRLSLDEDVNPLLAEQLRARGFDAISVVEAGRRGLADHEQLLFAARERRCLRTSKIWSFGCDSARSQACAWRVTGAPASAVVAAGAPLVIIE